MRITMIGDSAVGKTTFMMSTYGLMRDGIQGFKVKCTDRQADMRLYNAYQKFRKYGSYPDATTKMSSYNYNFYSDGDYVMSFSITDIRGETIHDIDVSELQKAIKKSDAVMLFLNAYDIVKGVDVEDSIDQLHIHLNNSFQVDERMKLLMVVFTHSDRVEWNEDNLLLIQETVADLKQIADRNDNLVFRIVPTACVPDCMMDLDYAMSLLMLVGYNREVLVAAELLVAEAKEIERQWGSGFWRDLKHAFGFDAERTKALNRAKELQKTEIPRFENMQEKFEKIRKFCEDYELGTYYSVRQEEDIFSL